MTNGEKFKEIFGVSQVDGGDLNVYAWLPNHDAIEISLEWWNAPYMSLNPEADREESKAYCAECDHIEMCSWYPHDGCEWLKTDRYNAGYNAAKREIALSGEYERAYERGKADAHPDINDGKLSEIPTGSESEKSNDIR